MAFPFIGSLIKMSSDEVQINKYLHMGLGEAIRRLLDVEIQYRHGQRGETLVKERNLILSALNRVELQIGFDCNSDGTPDTVEIFQQAAETSCCRITTLPSNSREPEVQTSRAPDPVPTVVSSRAPDPVDEVIKENEGLLGRLFGSGKKKQ